MNLGSPTADHRKALATALREARGALRLGRSWVRKRFCGAAASSLSRLNAQLAVARAESRHAGLYVHTAIPSLEYDREVFARDFRRQCAITPRAKPRRG